MDIHPAKPDRLLLGAAEHGPPAWVGYRAARTGPFNSPRSSRDVTVETGGAHAAILLSEDRGATWRRLANGLPDGNPSMVSSVKFSPDDPDTMFVTYTDGSLYRSQDTGESWRQLLSGIERLYGVCVLRS
jgi:hypothetical protein